MFLQWTILFLLCFPEPIFFVHFALLLLGQYSCSVLVHWLAQSPSFRPPPPIPFLCLYHFCNAGLTPSQQVPLKHYWCLSTRLHGITFQNTVVFISVPICQQENSVHPQPCRISQTNCQEFRFLYNSVIMLR
jgi:hypothetical protein